MQEERIRRVAEAHGLDPANVIERPMAGFNIKKPVEKAPAAFEKQPSPQEVIERRYSESIERASKAKVINELNTEELPEIPDIVVPAKKLATSIYQEKHPRLKLKVLSVRPKSAPSILEECFGVIRLHIHQHQSPGDILMLTAAVRDLHAAYPGKFITSMSTPCMPLWENNPYHTQMPKNEPNAMHIAAEYPLINKSNTGSYHFIHAFRKYLEQVLGLPIPAGELKGDIRLSMQETRWTSQVCEALGKDKPYWIINAGYKKDFTAKMWEHARYQQVVEHYPNITFVQVGSEEHIHEPLKGDNILNLIGKTDIRQFVRLMYHAAGVITPVSFAMHLSAATPMHPRYGRRTRPCIVIAGGREPSHWEAYTNHQYLHTCGMLPCCDRGGCWRSRILPLGDGGEQDNRLCERPVVTESGQTIPQCLAMIPVEEVLDKIDNYLEAYK